MVSEWIEAWEVWKGGVQVSSREKFGLVLGSVVLGILGGRELGSVEEVQVFWVEFGLMLVVEGMVVEVG